MPHDQPSLGHFLFPRYYLLVSPLYKHPICGDDATVYYEGTYVYLR